MAAGRALLGEPTELGGDYAALFAGALTVEVLVLADDPGLADAVERIRPYAGEVASYGSVLSLGSCALYVGSGLVALGQVDEGRTYLEAALAANVAAGSTRWEREARTQLATLV